jgi:hypothetical protein
MPSGTIHKWTALATGNATMITLRKVPRVIPASSAAIKKGRKGGISSIHIVTT